MNSNHEITPMHRIFDVLLIIATVAIWFAICCSIADRLATII